MKKNKLIALAIVAFLILVPFQYGYIHFSQESELVQVLSMAVVILGSIYAIFLFNKDTGDAHH